MLRNNVPGGDSSSLRPPAGVEKRAGGQAGRVLIEQLRASIRALEKVPVSLAKPPAPGAAPSRPACSLTPHSPLTPSCALTPPCAANDVSNVPPDNPPSNNPLSALRQGGLHEIKPHAYGDMPASLGFALSVIAGMKTSGLVLWCLTEAQAREWGRPYGPGLLKAGFDPSRFVVVETRNAEEAAWALEEGLKSGALAACLAQTEIKIPLAARRLGLAAQAARTPCFLLSPHGDAGVPGTLSRWRIATEGSAHVPFEDGAPGTACWRLSLERSRGGVGGAEGARFSVEADHEADGLRVAAASSDRTAEAGVLGSGQHTAAG